MEQKTPRKSYNQHIRREPIKIDDTYTNIRTKAGLGGSDARPTGDQEVAGSTLVRQVSRQNERYI